MTGARHYDLQDRLIDYAVRIIALSEALLAKADFAHKQSEQRRRARNDNVLPWIWIFRVGCWILKLVVCIKLRNTMKTGRSICA